MDSIEKRIRNSQGFCRDSIGNYIGIPQGVYMEIHGYSTRISKDNSIGNLQRNDEEFFKGSFYGGS